MFLQEKLGKAPDGREGPCQRANGFPSLHRSFLPCQMCRLVRESSGIKPLKCLTLRLAQGKADATAAVPSLLSPLPSWCVEFLKAEGKKQVGKVNVVREENTMLSSAGL